MSFKSYTFPEQPDDSLWLGDPQPLVFSGRQGLIVPFVLAAGGRAEKPWQLCPGELHVMATPALQLHE